MTDAFSSDEEGSGASSSDADGSDALPSNIHELQRAHNIARIQAKLAILMPAMIAAKRELEETDVQRRSHLAERAAARKAAKEAATQHPPRRSGRVIEVKEAEAKKAAAEKDATEAASSSCGASGGGKGRRRSARSGLAGGAVVDCEPIGGLLGGTTPMVHGGAVEGLETLSTERCCTHSEQIGVNVDPLLRDVLKIVQEGKQWTRYTPQQLVQLHLEESSQQLLSVFDANAPVVPFKNVVFVYLNSKPQEEAAGNRLTDVMWTSPTRLRHTLAPLIAVLEAAGVQSSAMRGALSEGEGDMARHGRLTAVLLLAQHDSEHSSSWMPWGLAHIVHWSLADSVRNSDQRVPAVGVAGCKRCSVTLHMQVQQTFTLL
ncbi:hypothetical protein JKP88DRAFT_294733 [Tribonema minus]|uniref:Uncharacterized protein n=1 Tax=Tribonema minus TaxID=303371 RepID=A0A835ZJG9_9STRA|nr:hypothetical protein JKP88DRAFT_294733 [Tribonema minus]